MTSEEAILKYLNEGESLTSYQIWLRIYIGEKPEHYYIGRPRRKEYKKYKPASIGSAFCKLVRKGILKVSENKKGPLGGKVYERSRG